jgi:tight adherence protein B
VSVALTAALAAVATGLALPRGGSCPARSGVSHRRGAERGRWPSVSSTPPAVAVSLVVASALLLGVPVLLLPTGALVTWVLVTLAARSRGDAQAMARRAAVVDSCEAMLGELAAGQPPQRALARAADVWTELAPVAGAGALGADVADELRALAVRPGAGALERLAGAWQLCAATGSGLASALEQVLATLRAEHEVVLAVRSELAAARATARLLAVLPLVVLVMAQGIGGDPWHFLLATVPGQLCLGLGALLGVSGVTWLERIADEAQGEVR